jgi:hypothetical protein
MSTSPHLGAAAIIEEEKMERRKRLQKVRCRRLNNVVGWDGAGKGRVKLPEGLMCLRVAHGEVETYLRWEEKKGREGKKERGANLWTPWLTAGVKIPLFISSPITQPNRE